MIRNARFGDYKEIFGILLNPKVNDFVETGRNASTREMMIEWQNSWRNTLVAEQNHKIVGFARYAEHSGKKAHVLELCTLIAKPQLQQKTVLEILLKELGKRHPAKQKIETTAVENNIEMLDFYSKFGFEIEGERKKNFLQNGKLLNEKLLAHYLE